MSAGLAVTGIGVVERPDAAGPSWFDVRAELGGRGYKYLPPAAHYLLVAARHATGASVAFARAPEARRGTSVGTSAALPGLAEEVDVAVAAGGADELSPATAPFFAVNAVAGRLAADQGITGFSLTTTSPYAAGLEAIEAGGRALRTGRCDVLLAAATEHLPGEGPGAEQGAVALVCHAEGRDPGAPVHGVVRVRTTFVPPELAATPRGRARVAAEVGHTLAALGASPAARPVAVLDSSPVAASVAGALAAGGEPAHTLGRGGLLPVRLIAGLLTTGGPESIVVAAAATGNLAFALVLPAAQGRAGGT